MNRYSYATNASLNSALSVVDVNYDSDGRRYAKMQWRSIVVGLVVLRLALNCVLWLAFGLTPGWGFEFPLQFSFNLHKLVETPRPDAEPRDGGWPQRRHEDYLEGTCLKINENTPRTSYFSFFKASRDENYRKYGSFPDSLKVQMKGMARDMFYFGYDNYMKYAFPEDELNPIDCEGRGPDVRNP